MEILVIPRRRRGPKKSHKGRQQSHHQAIGKYARQRVRTERNKAASRKRHLENHPNDLQAKRLIG
jgi:hypothetical protein